jgi:hypothetical protein
MLGRLARATTSEESKALLEALYLLEISESVTQVFASGRIGPVHTRVKPISSITDCAVLLGAGSLRTTYP